MADQGKVVSSALIGVEYDLDERGLPVVRLGTEGSPRFKILNMVEDQLGRQHPQVQTVGPDNTQQSGHALRLWIELTQAWQGNL